VATDGLALRPTGGGLKSQGRSGEADEPPSLTATLRGVVCAGWQFTLWLSRVGSWGARRMSLLAIPTTPLPLFPGHGAGWPSVTNDTCRSCKIELTSLRQIRQLSEGLWSV
jgi:hypothetical protein